MHHIYLLLLLLTSGIIYAQPKVIFTEYDLNPGLPASSPDPMITCNGKMYFVAISATAGHELWVSDGTLAGSSVIKDIAPGKADAGIQELVEYNNAIYFAADDKVHGRELWKTDGTPAGTQMVKDINTVTASYPTSFFVYNNILYFSATTPLHGAELWSTDGTVAGTQIVKDINPGPGSSSPMHYFSYNGKMLFNAFTDADGSEPWITDGTEAGTYMLKDINPATGNSQVHGMTVFNSKVYFSASTGLGSSGNGTELWVTDGTPTGTVPFIELEPGYGSGLYNVGKVYNGKLYFAGGNSGVTGHELYVTDGTVTGTQIVKDLYPGIASSGPSDMFEYKGRLYFVALNANVRSLWSTDGTATGTMVASNIGVRTNSSSGYGIAIYKNHIYFPGLKAVGEVELFVSDGTVTGTYMIDPGPHLRNALDISNHFGFLTFNDRLYFSASYNNIELWSVQDTTSYVHTENIYHIPTAFSLYPNPCNGNFTIKLSPYNPDDTTSLTVYDITGKRVYTQNITSQITQVCLSSLPKGVYEVKVLQDDVVSVQRVVIEH